MGTLEWLKSTLGIDAQQQLIDIENYVRLLPKTIEKMYPRSPHYPPDLVIEAIQRARLGTDIRYGLAMYCTREEFNAYFAKLDEYYDYDLLRSAIAKYQSGLDVAAVGETLNGQSRRTAGAPEPPRVVIRSGQSLGGQTAAGPAPVAADSRYTINVVRGNSYHGIDQRVSDYRQLTSSREGALPHDPVQVIRDLKAGNRRFMDGISYQSTRSSLRKLKEFAFKEQYPKAVILCCSDSRAPVEIICDQDIGDLFVIRVAGNIIAPSLVGSVEFALETFGTNVIVVMGHSRCGAVTAALDYIENGNDIASENVQDIVSRIVPNIEKIAEMSELTYDEQLSRCISQNVSASIASLKSTSPLIDALAREALIRIHGAVLDLPTGEVQFLDSSI